MQYLFLVHVDEGKVAALSQADRLALDEENLAGDAELREVGKAIVAGPLAPAEQATTVRVRNGQPSTTDGSVPETTEVLGGVMVVEAGDLAEAIQIAGGRAMASLGSIVVRPIVDLGAKVRERVE